MKQSAVLALVIVLGILARVVLWSVVPVTGDAVFHYSIARYISSHCRIPVFEYETIEPMWYPPAFHLLAAFFYSVFGSEKITPLFVSILSLFAFYILLKRFYGSLLLPGMILAAFLPTQMYYGAIGYLDSLFFLLAPLILYSYLSFLENKDYRFLGAALLLSAVSFLTHYHGFIPLLAISIHLFLRNKKAALVFLLAGLVLVSPWYVRNYVVFGNPIWPLLFDGKYPAHEGYQPSKMVNILSLSKWESLFFEYWVGAPNSGEDFARNVEIAGRYVPFPYLLFMGWLALVLAFTALSAYGMYALLRSDRNRSLFVALLLLSLIPLLLSNFIRMLVFVFPIFILGLATGLSRLKSNARWLFLALGITALLASTFAYAFVYHSIVDKYTPFYAKANAELPKDAVVCNMMDDVFFDRVDRTVISVGSIPGYRVTWKCLQEAADKSECFREMDVNYVCCTSLRTGNIGGILAETCDELSHTEPLIAYERQGVWGRCWNIK